MRQESRGGVRTVPDFEHRLIVNTGPPVGNEADNRSRWADGYGPIPVARRRQLSYHPILVDESALAIPADDYALVVDRRARDRTRVDQAEVDRFPLRCLRFPNDERRVGCVSVMRNRDSDRSGS